MSRDTRANRKRLALFQRGAAAAHRYRGSPELYFCPLCKTAFTQSALFTDPPELTLEHAPTKSEGGKVIALTCSVCNKKAGHSIDAAISHRANLMHLADVITHAVDGEGGRAALKIGSESVNIQIVSESNGPVKLAVLGGSNNLRVVERVRAYLEEHARESMWTGGGLGITSVEWYNPRLALVGDLKAAFIAAFAAFGYRYAFDPLLELVRQQILHPDEQVIDGWSIAVNQTGNDRYLALLTEPLSAVIVKLGRMDVLLPWLSSPRNFYDELATTYIPNRPLQWSGEYYAWPTTLKMECDIQ
jgi:hypothetical protein